jgi:hypothetical protein
MQQYSRIRRWTGPSLTTLLAMVLVVAPAAGAQDPQFQERINQIKEAMQLNKEAIGGYIWDSQQTISVKGKIKKQALYQVQLGPDGQPQKTELDPSTPPSDGRSHGLMHHIVKEKTQEFDTYAEQLGELAQFYLTARPGRLQELYQTGGITFGPAPGNPQEVRLILKSYLKPGDSATLVFNTAQNAVESLKISSYLNDPKDAVNIAVQFQQTPNGVGHVVVLVIDGLGKHVTINTQNSNYRMT